MVLSSKSTFLLTALLGSLYPKAVAHDLQQNGFGKRIFYDYIMPKIYTVMKYVAVKAIMVLVDQDNISGIKFYTSLQFSSVDEGVQKIVDDSFNENCKLYLLIL